jgi:hypothetical protein
MKTRHIERFFKPHQAIPGITGRFEKLAVKCPSILNFG